MFNKILARRPHINKRLGDLLNQVWKPRRYFCLYTYIYKYIFKSVLWQKILQAMANDKH